LFFFHYKIYNFYFIKIHKIKNAFLKRFIHRRSFILLSKEKGRKTKFFKKKSVGESYKKLLQTDGRTDRQKTKLLGVLLCG
jgi:hypothetical protein